ncbi:WD40-repeat-containing domain protein [Thamnocephalis sphaerospora]|uniref:Pre-mRNA-processing factor 17 n=1 Tax=Thamnocephalis sphaerospora TaxID=78915 RepID=A0A4V1IWA8_9FUNG|nr:WD40-repeat-containing domain protein [Thamnocephalis sphaerospora]|eukprot:RKP06909.1 WD40-repeat-containing domain protein [Thamnocephalis sphaerospora]
MDLLSHEYASESDEDRSQPLPPKRTRIDAAPDVNVEEYGSQRAIVLHPTDREIAVNVPYDDLGRPVLGPVDPYLGGSRGVLAAYGIERNVPAGHVEEQAFAEFDFRAQHRNFQALGYARDPSLVTFSTVGGVGGGRGGTGYVGDVDKMHQLNGATVLDPGARRKHAAKRKKKGNAATLEGENAYLGPWAGYDNDDMEPPPPPKEEEEEEESGKPAVREEDMVLEEKKNNFAPSGTEKTTFHGREEFDYQGRTYMHVPRDQGIDLLSEPGSQQCFLPKRPIHTYTGHTKGVYGIRFFPKSGHLLLSAGMDSKIKIWDVYHDRRCLRTYLGHDKAVRDICFSNDGRRFLSASYDRTIKLWDTETGKCISAFSNGKIPYCVKFHPDDDKQNVFLAGCSDKKIIQLMLRAITQYDINTGEIQQEYDQHLGAVNSITFVDDNRRFVTTSDDKTLRAWEFGIPIVIKYIAEPDMHSMPAVALHPNQKWIACQSLDNQILVYGARDRFRMNRKKRFTGHLIAGYACQPAFSADGRFLMSGDSEGRLWIWDWKTCRMLKKIKAHDNVLFDCAWHPHETSKVATASWDGTIKYWD